MADAMATPSDDELVSELGAAVEIDDEPWKRFVRIRVGHREEIHLWLNAIDRTVTVRWIVDEYMVVDVYRESATDVKIETADGQTYLLFEFGNRGSRSTLRVRVFPTVLISDQLLVS